MSDSENNSAMILGLPSPEFFGVLCALIGGILDNFGVCLQKLSHMRKHDESSYWKQPKWLSGMALYMTGTVLNGVGLGLAPQSMLAVLAPIGLVYNTVNSVFVLNETVSSRICAATVVIMVGSGLAIASGSRTLEPRMVRVSDLRSHFLTPGFILYFALLVILMFKLYQQVRQDIALTTTPADGTTAALMTSESDAVASLAHAGLFPNHRRSRSIGKEGRVEQNDDLLTASNDAEPTQGSHSVLHRFTHRQAAVASFPMLAGAFGSLTSLTWKCSIELIKSSVMGYAAFKRIDTYLLLCAVPVFGIIQVHVLNLALHRFDQLVVIPLYVITLELLNIIGGGVFFNELVEFSIGQAFSFIFAILVTFVGVFLLATGKYETTSTEWIDEPIDNTQSDLEANDIKGEIRKSDELEMVDVPL